MLSTFQILCFLLSSSSYISGMMWVYTHLQVGIVYLGSRCWINFLNLPFSTIRNAFFRINPFISQYMEASSVKLAESLPTKKFPFIVPLITTIELSEGQRNLLNRFSIKLDWRCFPSLLHSFFLFFYLSILHWPYYVLTVSSLLTLSWCWSCCQVSPLLLNSLMLPECWDKYQQRQHYHSTYICHLYLSQSALHTSIIPESCQSLS